MIFEEHKLKNGLKVLFIETDSPSITTILLVGAGSRYETEKNNGIAHFFEHMAFKGSKKYPSSFIISSTIEGLGAVFNAFTAKDHTGYWIKSTPEHFDVAIDVISDMVLNPLLDPQEIEREKGVIIEEINMYEDTPQRKVGELFEELLYKGNPLGFDIAGKKETVSSFKRNDFIDYMNCLYQPENALLVIAGGLRKKYSAKKFVRSEPAFRHLSESVAPCSASESEASLRRSLAQTSTSQNFFASYCDIIEEKFGQWKKTRTRKKFIQIKENQKKPQILIKTKKTEQAHFCLGYRAFSFFDKRKYALAVLSAILGGGMSSRLFIEVRERRGLCYYISTGREHYHDTGSIITQAGVSTDEKKVKEAVKVILDEHEKIKSKIDEKELRRVKEMLKGRFLLSLEDSSHIAVSFGSSKLLQNEIKKPEEIIKEIEKVTADEIKKLAQQLFIPQNLNFALIGPFKNFNFF
ncbi:MAG: insulinase family protein [Patescibacteria group bacterium]|nr:insulinase family protein [Patescibacteria group bacterium]